MNWCTTTICGDRPIVEHDVDCFRAASLAQQLLEKRQNSALSAFALAFRSMPRITSKGSI